ncbi:hypothetical protein [Pseudomonas phage Astolliot]|nr:hypothetical protein [Pseudomonas phage Astolliot]
MKIYEILEKIKVKPLISNIGICGNFDEYWFESGSSDTPVCIEAWEHAVNALDRAIKLWPDHSGFELFPVPDPDMPNPAIAYRNHWKSDTMWSGSDYACKRLELLVFLINHFRGLDQ